MAIYGCEIVKWKKKEITQKALLKNKQIESIKQNEGLKVIIRRLKTEAVNIFQ